MVERGADSSIVDTQGRNANDYLLDILKTMKGNIGHSAYETIIKMHNLKFLNLTILDSNGYNYLHHIASSGTNSYMYDFAYYLLERNILDPECTHKRRKHRASTCCSSQKRGNGAFFA